MTYQRGNGKDDLYIAPFVSKLIEMLNADDERAVVWSAGGRGFRVLDEEALEKRALPRFFKDVSHPPRARHRYASFRRQLNLYGFIKQRKGVLAGCYTHPCFRAGDNQLLALITRRKNSDQSTNNAFFQSDRCDVKISDIEHDPRRTTAILGRACGSSDDFCGYDRISFPMIFSAAVSSAQSIPHESGESDPTFTHDTSHQLHDEVQSEQL